MISMLACGNFRFLYWSDFYYTYTSKVLLSVQLMRQLIVVRMKNMENDGRAKAISEKQIKDLEQQKELAKNKREAST